MNRYRWWISGKVFFGIFKIVVGTALLVGILSAEPYDLATVLVSLFSVVFVLEGFVAIRKEKRALGWQEEISFVDHADIHPITAWPERKRPLQPGSKGSYIPPKQTEKPNDG